MTEQKESIFLECKDCHVEFEFTGGEQLYFEKNRLNPPKRCGMCRLKKRMRYEEAEQRESEQPA